MSAGLQARPVPRTPATTPPPPPDVAGRGQPGDDRLLVPLLLVMAAACLPLGRVFIGWGFLQPVLATVVIVIGLSWGCRRFGAGPLLALAVSALGWVAFVSAAFLGGTTVLGVIPTAASIDAFTTLWVSGFEVIATRPAPTFAEPSLMLLTVSGIWALTHAVDGIAFRIGAPVRALLPVLGLWLVPLLLTVGQSSPAAWTAPLLAASALLVLVATSLDVNSWGAFVQTRGPSGHRGPLGALLVPGAIIAGVAIVVGVLVAELLPGFDDPPWYEFGGIGGTTLTTNPIVSIRPSLVASDQGPVMRVATERPVYLRTTSLDVYSETGEWTNAGIRGTPLGRADGQMPAETPLAAARALDVEVEVVNLPGAVLVPAPYQPRAVTGEAADGFQYDPRLATLTTARGATLNPGDRYRVDAAVPDPRADSIQSMDGPVRPEHVALPANVPAEVVDLARRVVDDAGARTPFEQALALQAEFQSGRWEYSLTPPPGHSGDAMLAFITDRIGYCEQYAGTMAVMLRTLGVPARVAVGFTPGEQDPDGVYVVTNANAHAWVEVLFPGHGWLAFEPTPRDDGNVLTPSADNLVPEQTVQQQAASAPLDFPEIVPDDPFLPEEEFPTDVDGGTSQAGDAGGQDDDPGALGWLLALLIALIVVVSAGGLAARRRAAQTRTPLERVLDARERVGTVGLGLRVGATSAETDREYLQRLAGTSSAPGAPATAVALSERVGQARYAPHLPDVVAEEAEAAADALQGFLLAGRSGPARTVVQLRGATAAAASRLRETGRRAGRRVRRD